MTTVLITILIFGILMAMMAVGVIFSGRCLRGSCGGSSDVIGPDGEPIRCATCPKRKEDAERLAAQAAAAKKEELCCIEPVAVSPRPDEDD